MMNWLILISAVWMQFSWISGAPNPEGVGAYAYQDSDGHRYGGTYGLRDDQVNQGNFNPAPFGFDLDDFFPEYFRNFENILQDVEILYPLPPGYMPPLLPPLKPLRPFPQLFPPLQPLKPLQPLIPLRPLQPLIPLQPLQPLIPLQPLPPLDLVLSQLLQSQQPFRLVALPSLKPLQHLPPSPPLQLFRPLPPLKPLNQPAQLDKALEPLKPLQPLPPLQPLRSLQPLQPLPPLKPLEPLRPLVFPSLRSLPPLQPLQPLDSSERLQPLTTLPPLRPLQFALLRPWRLPPRVRLPILSLTAFKSNKEYQTKALESAKKAYDITSNQAGFMNFDFSRFPFNGGFGNLGMPNFGPQNFGPQGFGGQNSAFASGSVMPGYSHQVAAISPANPSQPNVDIKNRFGEDGNSNDKGGYMSVSSSSYATSSNVNGHQQSHRGAETVVDNNGVVHRYKVES